MLAQRGRSGRGVALPSSENVLTRAPLRFSRVPLQFPLRRCCPLFSSTDCLLLLLPSTSSLSSYTPDKNQPRPTLYAALPPPTVAMAGRGSLADLTASRMELDSGGRATDAATRPAIGSAVNEAHPKNWVYTQVKVSETAKARIHIGDTIALRVSTGECIAGAPPPLLLLPLTPTFVAPAATHVLKNAASPFYSIPLKIPLPLKHHSNRY